MPSVSEFDVKHQRNEGGEKQSSRPIDSPMLLVIGYCLMVIGYCLMVIVFVAIAERKVHRYDD